MPRMRNERLDALLREAGWSRAQAASAFNRVAQENNLVRYASIGRSHISMWVAGTKPTGQAPVVLCQALSRRLKRMVTPDELGFGTPGNSAQTLLDWHIDPLTTLVDLGRADLDAERRGVPDQRRVLRGVPRPAGRGVVAGVVHGPKLGRHRRDSSE